MNQRFPRYPHGAAASFSGIIFPQLLSLRSGNLESGPPGSASAPVEHNNRRGAANVDCNAAAISFRRGRLAKEGSIFGNAQNESPSQVPCSQLSHNLDSGCEWRLPMPCPALTRVVPNVTPENRLPLFPGLASVTREHFHQHSAPSGKHAGRMDWAVRIMRRRSTILGEHRFNIPQIWSVFRSQTSSSSCPPPYPQWPGRSTPIRPAAHPQSSGPLNPNQQQ